MRWQRQTIAITVSGKQRTTVEIEADVFGALAVHHTTHMPWATAHWVMAHVPTGRYISTANTERLARRFVRTVTPLLDWEHCMDLRDLPAEFWDAMHAAMRAAHKGEYVSEVRIG